MMTRYEKKRLGWLLLALAVVATVAWRLVFPRAPLADLKRTETIPLAPEAKETIDKTLAVIADNDMILATSRGCA